MAFHVGGKCCCNGVGIVCGRFLVFLHASESNHAGHLHTYAFPPRVQGAGGEEVGHQALVLKVAESKELAEDGGMTLKHLDTIMPFKSMMTQAELAYASFWAKMALGTSDDADCTAWVAQESSALVAQDQEPATSPSVMTFFG